MAEVHRLDEYRREELREHHLSELVRELSEQTATLARQEVELAKIELAEKGRKAAVGAGLMTGGTSLSYLALGAFTAAAILGLAEIMQAWLAALIVGGIYLVIAGVLFGFGWFSLRRAAPPIPEETVETIREDAEWIRRRSKSAAR